MSSPLILALAVSLAQLDASVNIDGGGGPLTSLAAQADVAWTVGGAKFVWVSEKRELVYALERRRGPDLWVNEVVADGGLQWAQGRVLCPAKEGETFSMPRIASNAVRTWVVWKVTSASGETIRGGELLATGVDCARAVHLAPANVSIDSLQLEESGNTFVAFWETPTNFVTLALNSPNALVQNVHAKLQAPTLSPSFAPRVGGFYVGWLEGINFLGQQLNGLGAAVGTVENPFLGHRLSAPPVVVGPPLRAVLASSTTTEMTDTLKSGPINSVAPTPPAVGASLAQGPLLASVEPLDTVNPELWRTRALYHLRGSPEWYLTDFSPLAGQPVAVTPGVEPLAMAGAVARTALLSSVGGELTVAQLTGLTGQPTNFVGARTRTETSQRYPSAVWLPSGEFAVGFLEGSDFLVGRVNPVAPNVVFGASTLSTDGGVYRMLPRDEGGRLSATIDTAQSTSLVVGELDQGQLSATPLLTVTRSGMSQGVAGANVGVLWAPGSSFVVYGTGTKQSPPPGLVTFGRCGARVDNHLLVPTVSGAEVKVLVMEDLPGATPIAVTVGSDALGLEPPCLVARDRELLIVATGAEGQLRMWTMAVEDLLSGGQASELGGFDGKPRGRKVRNPVAVGTREGWQVAFESVEPSGGHIAQLRFSNDFRLLADGAVSNGIDDRSPVLAVSDRDEVLLVFQQFIDVRGAVVVRAQHLEQTSGLDAGVADGGARDAGTEEDGGVLVSDGGLPDAGEGSVDGGVTLEPVKFTACGCEGAGGPALLALALLLVGARRRRS